jgi:uncharacterized protein (TIGR02391 family)
MATLLDAFELIVRRAHAFDEREEQGGFPLHPFDRRNIHPSLPTKVRRLFDDGHYPEATFEALKCIDKVVQKHSKVSESGMKLMMQVFDEVKPVLRLTALSNASEIDEQKGYRFLFSGAVMAIRNPRGHEVNLTDDPDMCLDHLAFASLLLRRLEQSGFA